MVAMILFIDDERRGCGHKVRCEAIMEAVTVLGGDASVLLRKPHHVEGPDPLVPVKTVVISTHKRR